MATLKSPVPPNAGRISQVLPTVKCSNCNASVSLTDLGEHVCVAAPATPSKSASSLLPSRLQGLVSRSRNSLSRNAARSSSQVIPPPRSTSQTPPARNGTPPSRNGTPPSRQGTPSIKTPQRQQSPPQAPAVQQNNAAQLGPGWSQTRVPSPLSSSPGSLSAGGGKPTLQERMRAASTTLKEPQRPFAQRDRAMSADLPPPRPAPQQAPPPSPGLRDRRPSNAPQQAPPPSPGLRDRKPSNASQHRPSFDDRRPSMDQRPSFDVRGPPPAPDRRPSFDSRPMPPPDRRPSFDDRKPADRRPSFDTGAVRVPPRQSSHAVGAVIPLPGNSPPLPSLGPGSIMFPSSEPAPVVTVAIDPDTKVGGDAGMAGVGRRGFAAAARAAMFANTATHLAGAHWQGGGDEDDATGMGGRRDNAPKYLDINTSMSSYSGTTPPLSPGGYSPHSPTHVPPSPNPSMLSSRSSVLTARPNGFGALSTTPSSRTPSPASTVVDNGKPFFEKFRDHLPPVDTTPVYDPLPDPHPSPISPMSSGSEYEGGLAYADSDADDSDNDHAVLTPMSPPQETTVLAPAAIIDERDELVTAKKPPKGNQVRFPSVDEKHVPIKSALKKSPSAGSSASSGSGGAPLVYGSPSSSRGVGPATRERSNSANSAASGSNYSHSTAKSTHALDRAMETLFEEGPSAAAQKAKGGRANTIPGLGLEPLSPEHRPPKMPARSQTGPSHVTFAEPAKEKECVRCEAVIEDGRWIQTDTGGVLCERCWKNMYLPKCRRCNLPIEKQAVSSSDGQLKGKYHRECFNCYECHKPFPDKEFYVHDGKPLCAYHYHAANESLCASCGEPIEGPCAVSHTGDRYHPEHLRCEYPGCQEALDEYWEADGKMMCERHAEIVGGYHTDEDDGAWAAETKAQKRITRFIDLADVPDPDEEEGDIDLR